jgi:alanine racemase
MHAEAHGLSKWIEIDFDAVIHNVQLAKASLGAECKLMVVLKADAYGLGLVETGRLLDTLPEVDMFGVADVEEGLLLRRAEIKKPVLVFYPVDSHSAALIREFGLTATVDSIDSVRALAGHGRELHPCHLKINTGMNSLGVLPREAWKLIAMIEKSEGVQLEGIYTSLSRSSSRSKNAALRQLKDFDDFIRDTDLLGIPRGIAHAADTPSFIRFPQFKMGMVRLGSYICGETGFHAKASPGLLNPYRLYARVIALQELQKGDPVGIGGDHISTHRQTIAALPVGYADGFSLEPNDRDLGLTGVFLEALLKVYRLIFKKPLHYVRYRGQPLLPVGRIGMHLSTVKTNRDPISVGDVVEVVVNKTLSSARISRFYYSKGNLVAVRKYGIPDGED